MTHTAARVIHIAHESWNEMDMQVKDRLSRRGIYQSEKASALRTMARSSESSQNGQDAAA